MMSDYKVLLRDIVEMFYQPPFKIFNINSIDGETIIRPFGYFISLGITTSFDVMKNIRDILNNSDYGFEAKIVELRSVKSELYGDYLNILSNIPEEEIKKYKSLVPEDIKILGEEEAKSKLSSLMTKISEGDYSVTPEKQKLQEVIGKIEALDGGWNNHEVQMRDENTYGVFHKYVNYRKENDSEFRLGIYVTKN